MGRASDPLCAHQRRAQRLAARAARVVGGCRAGSEGRRAPPRRGRAGEGGKGSEHALLTRDGTQGMGELSISALGILAGVFPGAAWARGRSTRGKRRCLRLIREGGCRKPPPLMYRKKKKNRIVCMYTACASAACS